MGANGIPGAWRKEKAHGGGMMLDWGVHLIDQMLCMVEGKITSIFANYSYEAGEEVDDGFNMEVKFDTGVTYRIVVDTNTFIKPPRWKVYGKDGTAVINNWQLECKIVHCVIRHDDKLEGISAGNGYTKTMASRRSETVEKLPIKEKHADKAALYLNFVKAIRLGEKTMVTREQIESLFKVMELAERGLIGRIAEVESADGSRVEIVVQ
jgi:predicted dehydrogenase